MPRLSLMVAPDLWSETKASLEGITMWLNGEQAGILQQNARKLLEAALPYKTDDAKFKVVCRDYGGGGSTATTCGYLCHWMLWKLGVSDQNLVDPTAFHGHPRTIINRKETGFTYMHGENISRLVHNKFFIRAYGTTAVQVGKRPRCGDIVYIHEEPKGAQSTEHVFVYVDEIDGKWYTAESGQEYGKWGKFRDDRQLLLGLHAKVTGNNPIRSLIGWLPIDQLDYRAIPTPMTTASV